MEDKKADKWMLIKSEDNTFSHYLVLIKDGEELGKIGLDKNIISNINKYVKYRGKNLLNSGIIVLLLFLIFLISFIAPIANSLGNILTI